MKEKSTDQRIDDLDQKIDAVEFRLNKKIDEVKDELTERIDNIDQKIDRLSVKQNNTQEIMFSLIGRRSRMITSPSDIAQLFEISIAIDNEIIAGKKFTDNNWIFIEGSDLYRQPQRLLEYKTEIEWESIGQPETQFARADSTEIYIFRDSDDRVAVVTLGYMPIPRDAAREMEYEIVDDINLSLLD